MGAVFVALLRAVNVGGTGKLPMEELRAICEALGFTQVRTYIASGNVVFKSNLSAVRVKSLLQKSLTAHAGRPVDIFLRTASEIAAVAAANPFPGAAPNRTLAVFLDAPPAADALKHVTGQKDEQLWLGLREIYIHYGESMATSKLKVPAARKGTARNLNTVSKLAQMAGKLENPELG